MKQVNLVFVWKEAHYFKSKVSEMGIYGESCGVGHSGIPYESPISMLSLPVSVLLDESFNLLNLFKIN